MSKQKKITIFIAVMAVIMLLLLNASIGEGKNAESKGDYFHSWLKNVTTSSTESTTTVTVGSAGMESQAWGIDGTASWTLSVTDKNSKTGSTSFKSGTGKTVSKTFISDQTFKFTRGSTDKTVTISFAVTCKVYNNGKAKTYTETASIKVTIPAKEETYTVTYINNGTRIGTQTKTKGEPARVWDAPSARTGYTFLHWDIDTTSTSRGWGEGSHRYYPAGSNNMYNGPQTLTAHWQANQSEVKLDGNGGTFYGETAKTLSPKLIYDLGNWNDIGGYADNAARTGYTLTGFYDKAFGGNKVWDAKGKAVNGKYWSGGLWKGPDPSYTMYAQWAPITYSVIYNGNGSTSGSMSSQNFTYDKSQNLTENIYHKKGFKFAGWNTKADGTGTAYTDKQSVINLATVSGGAVNLYAQWKKVSYGVKFYPNGGIGKTYSKEYRYDVSYNLPANGFTKKGKKFIGWKVQSVTDPDGKTVTGSAASVVGNTYSDKALVKNLTDIDGYVINMYAQWADSDDVSISTVTSDYNGKVSLDNSFTADSRGKYEKSYSLSSGNSMTFKGLPSNTGQLTEEFGTEGFIPYFNVTKGNPAGSTSGSSKVGKDLSTGQSTLNEDTTYSYANYKNEVKDVTVAKRFVSGHEGDPSEEFNFRAHFTNLEESRIYHYHLYKPDDNGESAETGSGYDFTTSNEGSADVDFKLKANEYVIFSALPNDGKMSVTEFENGYRRTADYAGKSDSVSSGQEIETHFETIADLSDSEAAGANIMFTNINDSSFSVYKEISGNRADRDKKFTFTANFTGLGPNTKYDTNTESASGAFFGAFTSDPNGNAAVRFAISSKEHFTVSNLPHGTRYTIHEDSGGYDSSYDVTSGKDLTKGETGTIEANRNITYAYTNKKQVDYTDKAVRVEKKIAGSAASADDSFLYYLSLTGLEKDTKYVLKTNGSDKYELSFDKEAGSIKISKTAEDGTVSDATSYTPVIVTEMDSKGNKTVRWAGGTAELSAGGELTGSLTYEGGLQSFTSDSSGNASSVSVSLKAGESFTLDTVPKGTKYQITEAAKDGYTPKYESAGNGENEGDELSGNAPAGSSLSVPEQTLDKDITFTFTNSKFKRKMLKLGKEIEGDAADPNDAFKIGIHVSDAEPDAEYVAMDDASVILKSDSKGNIDKEIKLKGGESHIFSTLPDSCSVWVSEDAAEGYVPSFTVSSMDDNSSIDSGSGFVGLDLDTGSYDLSQNMLITVTNKKSLKNDLMIRKDSVGEGRDKDDAFTFNIKFKGLKANTQYQVIKENIEVVSDPDDDESTEEEKRTQIDTASFTSLSDGTADYTAKLKASEEITIKGLPNTAVYRITEKGNDYTPAYMETKGSNEFEHERNYNDTSDEETGVHGSGEKNKDLSTEDLALDMDTEITFTNQKDADPPQKNVSDTDNITKYGEGEEKDITENTVESKKSKWTYTITQVCPNLSNGDDGSEGLSLSDDLPDLVTTDADNVKISVNGIDASSSWTKEIKKDEFGTRIYAYSNDGVVYKKGDKITFSITAWLDPGATADDLSGMKMTDDGLYYVIENTASVFNGYSNFDTNTVKTNIPKETSGLSVSKNVKGSLGDRTKDFEFKTDFSGLEKNKTYTGKRSPELGYYYLSLSEGKLKFSVKDRNGSPVKGIEADFDADDGDSFTLTTGDDGMAESPITCGEWQCIVSAADVPNSSTMANISVSGKNGADAAAGSILAGETSGHVRISQGKTFTVTSDSNGKASFTEKLKDDESYTISGLPTGATYDVNEAASDHAASFVMTKGAENAKTKSKKNDRNRTDLSTGTETLDGAAGYVFTNTRNLAPSSGVNGISILLLILIGAAAGAAVYFVKIYNNVKSRFK